MLAVAVMVSWSAMATSKDEGRAPEAETLSDKLQIEVYFSTHEEWTEDICKHYILLENETSRHVVIYLVYTDQEGEHRETHHSQTWSDGGFKKRIYTKGMATVNKRESGAEYM